MVSVSSLQCCVGHICFTWHFEKLEKQLMLAFNKLDLKAVLSRMLEDQIDGPLAVVYH